MLPRRNRRPRLRPHRSRRLDIEPKSRGARRAEEEVGEESSGSLGLSGLKLKLLKLLKLRLRVSFR